ncbi:hypothetical protein L1887_03333 [Cichorium endivia]|nr:hypothetical protein L1887_03333 [Cichorium endivia]
MTMDNGIIHIIARHIPVFSTLYLSPSPLPTILELPTPSLYTKRPNRSKSSDNRNKMSWQAYVDDHLMCEIEGNHLSAAAIIGHDGSIWAQSPTFPAVKPEEITAIMKDFDEPGSLAPTGLYLGGTKYMVIQGEAGVVIRGKKGPGGFLILFG